MISCSVEEIARVVSGTAVFGNVPSDYQVIHLSVDSRTLLNPEGTVYFALRGLRNDGHQYVEELQNRGVRIFVVSAGFVPLHPGDSAFIFVPDTLEALQQLASYHRSGFDFPVIGITGSNGKTIVKEWLYDLLAGEFSIVRSPRSYNSQTGVPLSVWLMQPSHNLGIFEAGISMPGEMENLETIIRPTLGIFTNIGDAHQENFRTTLHKVSEKLCLFRRSRKLIFRLDNREVAGEVTRFCHDNGILPLGWSLSERKAPLFFKAVEDSGSTILTAFWEGGSARFMIPFTDVSSVENSCHCFAALLALGIHSDKVTAGFIRLVPLAMRLEIKKGINGSMLINDYYNSDINSLGIALSVLNRQAEKDQLQRIVILSDIRQSGLPARELYRQVNQFLKDAGVEKIIGIGNDIRKAEAEFTMEKQFFGTTEDFIRRHGISGVAQAAILIKGARDFRFEEISAVLEQKVHQTILEINLNALLENLNLFRSLLLPGTKVMVMVKAFSYGSGDVEIAKLLQYARVDYLAVAVTDEGKELRNAGISLPIIVMNPEQHSFQQMIDYRLEPNLYSVELARQFALIAAQSAVHDFPVHLKIDTGMNRLGLKSDEETDMVIVLLRRNPQLRLQSVFSHLAASEDQAMDRFTHEQIARFREVSDKIVELLGYPVDRHILNSAGIERFGEFQFDMVRLGIGLYGISTTSLPLKPISRLKSRISQIKTVELGETVGYNRAGAVKQKSQIAVIPVGYADGLDRRLGNGTGKVFLNGSYVPITGNICMDMCMVDVTGVPCQPGDEAEFFGERISIREVAEAAGTIPYEILTGISQRVKRIYTQE